MKQLYDLRHDVGETINVIDHHPDIFRELSQILTEYIRSGRSTEGVGQPFSRSRHDGRWPQIGWIENDEEIINPGGVASGI